MRRLIGQTMHCSTPAEERFPIVKSIVHVSCRLEVFQSVTDEDFRAYKTEVHPTGGKRTKAITTNYYSLDLQRLPVLTTMDLCPWYVLSSGLVM